ncbi:hypothetical protein TNCV_3773381 [Trichonephila clavipes]|nr:hypothetical protein TNCV_3773381 [Trichonephila clavipes]
MAVNVWVSGLIHSPPSHILKSVMWGLAFVELFSLRCSMQAICCDDGIWEEGLKVVFMRWKIYALLTAMWALSHWLKVVVNIASGWLPMWDRGGTLNSRREASPLVRLVEGEERWETPDHSQVVLPQTLGGTEPNRTVTPACSPPDDTTEYQLLHLQSVAKLPTWSPKMIPTWLYHQHSLFSIESPL